MPSSSTILLVDDEESIQTLLTYPLERDGYTVVQARDGEEALRKFEEDHVDLVVLDVMLPRLDGLEVCKRLRSQSNVPIIMLTARGEELDKVLGLELGADDYITKPFSIREFRSRIRALLRRAGSPQLAGEREELIERGELRIDVPRRTVEVRGEPVQLTFIEFEMLVVLAQSPGVVFSRRELLEAATGEAALDRVERDHPDIVLLDIGLPDIDGFEVLRQIRAFSDVPIVMLTARDDAMDKVKGLELGADDYITKPFNHLELMARVKAVLRRLSMPTPTSRAPSFQSGDLEVDFAAHEARLRGERLELTPTEYKLLYHLVRNAGHVLQHETLLAKVWGREYVDEVDYLRVYVRRLRDKLGDDPDRPRYIRTERGLGYRFIA